MRLQVNGHVLTHRQDRERMLTGGWDRKKIAAKYLKEGTNEFVFSHSGVLHIDPFPRRSGRHPLKPFEPQL